MPESFYASRPWLRHYDSFVPPELPLATRTLLTLVEDTARALPHQPAVHHFHRTLSWSQLDERASRFAALLEQWGIGYRDRVAVWLQNDPEFLIAVYGAWKRGAIVVPLSPMFKQKEMAYHLRDSGARVLVAIDALFQSHAAPVLPDTRVVRVLTLEEMPAALDSVAPASRNLPLALDDVAYLVYTSGTTGQPKGAMCLHRNISFNTEVFRTWMQVSKDDVILGMAPLFHVTGLVAQMSLSALSGAPLLLYHRFDAGQTLALVEKWKPTYALAAITAYIALMNHPDAGSRDLTSLRKTFSGGAPVAPAVADQYEQRCGSYIHNTYGLTESNSPATITPMSLRGPVDPRFGALSIGVPIPNLEVRILDTSDRDRIVEPGESGELALRGPMIFPGYWDKPEATAEAFHDGWFLTGDIAMMDPAGWIYLVDRKKDMIVCSGFKVWPREVEDVLYQHPAVKEAAVVGVPDDYRGETVRAFIALRDGLSATPEEVMAFCKERMAAYKYPRQVVIVPEIPKTATGKFLRRELRGMNP